MVLHLTKTLFTTNALQQRENQSLRVYQVPYPTQCYVCGLSVSILLFLEHLVYLYLMCIWCFACMWVYVRVLDPGVTHSCELLRIEPKALWKNS